MKSLLLACLIALPVAAHAASPEEAYFAARDAAVTRLGALVDGGASGTAFSDPHEAALKQLTQQLAAIVGPVAVKGFVGPGKINIETLVKGDQGFGMLDALTFGSADGKGTLLVTTGPILDRWLVEQRDWWQDNSQEAVPQTAEAAARSEAFMTQALQSDAAFSQLAEVAIVKPAGATLAVALLGGRSQDQEPEAPTELVVTVSAAGRVSMVEVPLKATLAAVPDCSKILSAATPKIAAANQQFNNGGRKNDTLAARVLKLQTDASQAFYPKVAAGAARQHADSLP